MEEFKLNTIEEAIADFREGKFLIVVDDEDDVMLINSDGIIIRMEAKEISKLGRATQGVKIMNVKEDTNIISLAKVARQDELEKEIKEDLEAKDGEQVEIK